MSLLGGGGSAGRCTRGAAGWEVLVEQDRFAVGELLEEMQWGEVVVVFAAGAAAFAVVPGGDPVGLGAGLAHEVRPVAQGFQVGDPGQEHAHLGVGHHGAGDFAAAVEVLDLGEVVVDEQQLDAVAAGGGEQVG
jgi:hypothetical protein